LLYRLYRLNSTLRGFHYQPTGMLTNGTKLPALRPIF